MVRIERLDVVRGRNRALSDVTFDVGPGVTGLLGPSGCGKTTLMRVVVGVQQITSGRAEVLGLPAGAPGLRRRIGYVTQAPAVYPDLTVRENLHFFAQVLGCPGQVPTVLEQIHLVDEADRVTDRLSGGQRSRVSLGVALLGKPDLLVLDEPTVGLDPVLRRDLWDLFHRLADDGAALLVSSHVMDEAERCDTLVLLREGRVLGNGTPHDLKTSTGTADLESAFLALVEGPADLGSDR